MRFSGVLLLALLGGCARYEYDITRPQEAASHIGTQDDAVITREPLEYRLRTVENRLVMRIYNTGNVPLTLLGERSCVVDPSGQSHPLPTQTIATRSYIKLILPPFRPRIERPGLSIEIGVGTTDSGFRRRGYGWDGYDGFEEPRYIASYDGDALYWEWTGETSVRLMLVYQQAERTFEQEMVVSRRKM